MKDIFDLDDDDTKDSKTMTTTITMKVALVSRIYQTSLRIWFSAAWPNL